MSLVHLGREFRSPGGCRDDGIADGGRDAPHFHHLPTGLRRAVGELLTCPFCLGTWIASGFIYGYVFTPRISRILASIFAVSGLADFLQQLYVKTQEMNE